MNLINNLVFLTNNFVVTADDAKEAVTAAASAAGEAAASAAPAGGTSAFGGAIGLVIWLVVIFAMYYFMLIKPQKKREKEMTALQNATKIGDWVVTTSGFYGKVADIYDNEFVIEFGTNKGVRIPVAKSEVIANKEPGMSKSAPKDNE